LTPSIKECSAFSAAPFAMFASFAIFSAKVNVLPAHYTVRRQRRECHHRIGTDPAHRYKQTRPEVASF
jgi:hypothetical protein